MLDSLLPANILLLGSLALFAGCVLLSLDVLKEGLVQLTNLAPNGDTLALFAALFTLVDGVTMVFTPLRESAIPFFSPCALVLTFHLLGRYCDRSAKFQACRVAASVSQPYLVTQDPNVLGGRTAFRKWLGVPKGFGSQIRTTSQAEARFRRLTPVLLVACFCLSLVTTVAHHQPNLIFWSLSALFTAAATLGVSLALNLPLRMLGGSWPSWGWSWRAGPACWPGKGCKAALLLDQDIYPPGTVALAGSRVFGSLSMERTVAFTASVIRASGSGLTYLFDKLVRAEGSGYLPIEKIVMQETGLLGQCQGQQILVGNSDFMSRQGIALPPGIRAKDAVFCAVDRELVGMFVLKYTLHPAITPALQSMVLHRIAPVMVTRDFNLNPHRLRLWGPATHGSADLPGPPAAGDPVGPQPAPRSGHSGRPVPGGNRPLLPGPHRRQAHPPGGCLQQLFCELQRLRGGGAHRLPLQCRGPGRHVRLAPVPVLAAVAGPRPADLPVDHPVLIHPFWFPGWYKTGELFSNIRLTSPVSM